MSYAACVYYVTVEHALKSWILVVGKKHITVNKVFATQLPLKLKVHCLKSSLFNILSLVTFIKHRGEIVIILNYEIWRFSKMLWQLPFFFSYPFECWFSQAVFSASFAHCWVIHSNSEFGYWNSTMTRIVLTCQTAKLKPQE